MLGAPAREVKHPNWKHDPKKGERGYQRESDRPKEIKEGRTCCSLMAIAFWGFLPPEKGNQSGMKWGFV